jgi:SecD/SecF fusion protein
MPKRASLWRLIAAIAIIAVSVLIALSSTPKLGLDLKGGTQILLETQDGDRVKADATSTERALEIIRGRVDALGVAEPTLVRAGDRRIIVELPGVQDPREAVELIGQTAQLAFHEVKRITGPGETTATGGGLFLRDEGGQPLALGKALLGGADVEDANAVPPQLGVGQWAVDVSFNKSGINGWRQLVADSCANPNAGNRIAIVLDDKVISSPGVVADLCAAGGGNATTITGNFSTSEAKDLSLLIKGGALPVPVDVLEQRTVGPTLGKEAIDASIEAAVIGVALTGLFIVIVYRLTGLMAALGLVTYAVIAYGLLTWLRVTLTLPGLAGFVLAIGLAIDANVLVLERAREELAARPRAGPAPAIAAGFNKAWSAILDSNVTTLLAALLLFFVASGPVKGFGVTLSIGVVASMISALVIARVLTEWLARRTWLAKRVAVSGIAGVSRVRKLLTESGINIMHSPTKWVLISAAVGFLSVGGLVARGLNLGVEFTGGRLMEYSATQTFNVDTVREAVSDAGFPTAVVQASSGDGRDNLSVRLGNVTNEQAHTIEQTLNNEVGGVEKVRDELVGPSLGQELRNKALLAFAIAVAAQMLYLALRFRWTYAASAVASMASVVLTVVGTFAWLGKPIDGAFLAAILSIIGLAVNDTIVVFDRVRENLQANQKRNIRDVVNDAILATIPRTINTGLGAMFILGALAVLGGDSLTDFAVALIIGLSVGILSTIFTASALAVVLEERWPQLEDEKQKVVDPYANIGVG